VDKSGILISSNPFIIHLSFIRRKAGRGVRASAGRAMAESELAVVTKAKDLCSYIMTVTQKSPKHFRFTLMSC